MSNLEQLISEAIALRIKGKTSPDICGLAPPGHMLQQQISSAALAAGNATGVACNEKNASSAPTDARVVVSFVDPLEDLPFERFASYQAKEIIAIWKPSEQYQHLDHYRMARRSVLDRLQPLILLHALEGNEDDWGQVLTKIEPTGERVLDLSLSRSQALDMAMSGIEVSRVNRYLKTQLLHHLPYISGQPGDLIDSARNCAAALDRIPSVDHPAYQQRMAGLPCEVSRALSGVLSTSRAMEVGEAIHKRISVDNTPLNIKISRNRAARAG